MDKGFVLLLLAQMIQKLNQRQGVPFSLLGREVFVAVVCTGTICANITAPKQHGASIALATTANFFS